MMMMILQLSKYDNMLFLPTLPLNPGYAMSSNAMPDSGFQSNFSNGCVNAVFNYSVSINNPYRCKFM